MTIVHVIIAYEYNGAHVVSEVADGSGGWPDIVKAAESASRVAINKLETEFLARTINEA